MDIGDKVGVFRLSGKSLSVKFIGWAIYQGTFGGLKAVKLINNNEMLDENQDTIIVPEQTALMMVNKTNLGVSISGSVSTPKKVTYEVKECDATVVAGKKKKRKKK